MNKQPLKFFVFTSLLCYACLPTSSIAVEYYKNDFESGAIPTFFPDVSPGQIWTLAPSFVNVYGPNNHFNVSSSSAHNGNFSLRFTYEAQNGICNTCGSISVTHAKQGHDQVGSEINKYFIADDGADLSITDNPATTKKDDGPKAEPGKFVYNRNGGFSKWEIVSVINESVTNDRVNLKLITKGINGESSIIGGDRMDITRHCGVDGLIGIKQDENDIDRRSDCNSVITWFANVTPQPPGQSIYRRTYLKAEITSPNIRQKLHYLRPDRRGPLEGEVVIFGHYSESDNDYVPQLTGTNKFGSTEPVYLPGKGLPNDLSFKRGVWYYLEEQYQAATVKTITNGIVTEYNNDGAYRLWFSKAGEEPTDSSSPTFVLNGLSLPPITGGSGTHISFWGNVQHSVHARGSWYIDDVIISDQWNGAVPFNGTNTAPPNFPRRTTQ